MTTYKGIKGLGIQNVTSDAIASQAAGGSPPGTSYAGTEEWNYTHAFKKITTS